MPFGGSTKAASAEFRTSRPASYAAVDIHRFQVSNTTSLVAMAKTLSLLLVTVILAALLLLSIVTLANARPRPQVTNVYAPGIPNWLPLIVSATS